LHKSRKGWTVEEGRNSFSNVKTAERALVNNREWPMPIPTCLSLLLTVLSVSPGVKMPGAGSY
jgi:hypothetical protein